MKQPLHLFEDRAGDIQPLELGAERGPHGVEGVAFEGLRRGRLQPVAFLRDPGQISLKINHGSLNQGLFFPAIILIGEMGPVVVAGIHRGHDGIPVMARPGPGIIERKGFAPGMHVQELRRVKVFGPGGEQEITHIVDFFSLPDADIDLAAGIVDPHRLDFLQEFRGKRLDSGQVMDGIEDAAVGDHTAGRNESLPALGLHRHSLDRTLFDYHFFYLAPGADGDPVLFQFRGHHPDQSVGAALEGKDPLVHEIGKNNAIGDGRVVQGGAVGISDRLHQQPVHVAATGKKILKQLPGGQGPVVVEVHPPDRGKEILDHHWPDLEPVPQNSGEVGPVKGGFDGKLGVVKDDILQLDNGVGDLTVPVFATGLDHPVGKAMQGDVEDMSLALEPGGQAAELVVMLQEQNLVAAMGQPVGRRKAAQAGTDDHHVIPVGSAGYGCVPHVYYFLLPRRSFLSAGALAKEDSVYQPAVITVADAGSPP